MSNEVEVSDVELDSGSYSYLNQLLEEFNSTHDFLTTFAFGKRTVEKEFKLILDTYFNKSLQEFFDYLVNKGQVVCEVSASAKVNHIECSTTVFKEDLELDEGCVTNGHAIFEDTVMGGLLSHSDIQSIGDLNVDYVSLDNEHLQLPWQVENRKLDDIIYGQEVVV